MANASTYNIASVNLSLGSGNVNSFRTTRLSNKYAALAAQDIVVSVASGNDFARINSVQGVNLFSADPNVLSIGAVYDSNVGDFSYGGTRAFSTGADRITPFSQRNETLTTVFAPGAPIRGANANGGFSTLHGTSQAAPYVAGIVPLAQELAVREIGRRLTETELRNLLRSTGVTINDGDDEHDNVRNTGLDFKRVDVQALGEAIIALGGGCSPPTVSITSTPVTQEEGDSGTTAYAFTVTLNNASSEVVTVNYSTNDGTATVANGDYIDNDDILTFNPGETSQTITVEVNGDTTVESNEQFTVTLNGANNGVINSTANTSTGIITNDDTPPVVSFAEYGPITLKVVASGRKYDYLLTKL